MVCCYFVSKRLDSGLRSSKLYMGMVIMIQTNVKQILQLDVK